MRRECWERFPRHHGVAIPPWCMPGSLTSGFLWSRWRGKRSRYSRRMRNPRFCVSGKRPMYVLERRSAWALTRLINTKITPDLPFNINGRHRFKYQSITWYRWNIMDRGVISTPFWAASDVVQRIVMATYSAVYLEAEQMTGNDIRIQQSNKKEIKKARIKWIPEKEELETKCTATFHIITRTFTNATFDVKHTTYNYWSQHDTNTHFNDILMIRSY